MEVSRRKGRKRQYGERSPAKDAVMSGHESRVGRKKYRNRNDNGARISQKGKRRGLEWEFKVALIATEAAPDTSGARSSSV